MKTFDPSRERGTYHVLTRLVVPRPIGWISTLGADGRPNLAPFSYFNAVSSNPPVVMFSAGSRDGEPKDTPRNALDTGEFVVNLVTEDLAEAMDVTSAPIDGNEFEYAGLEPAASDSVAPPRVAAAAAALECTVHEHLRIGANTVVFGSVERIHVADRLLADGEVDARAVDAVGRLGGPYYTGIRFLDVERSH